MNLNISLNMYKTTKTLKKKKKNSYFLFYLANKSQISNRKKRHIKINFTKAFEHFIATNKFFHEDQV